MNYATMPCSATAAERDTDAGTIDRFARRPGDDDSRDRDQEVRDEARLITRVIAGIAKDIGPDGLARSVKLDNEIACGVIDAEGTIEHLVRLICARRAMSCTVTDAEIAAVIEGAVVAQIEALADARVDA